jgi:GNAT superfamily N-acetyltransferase
VTKSVITTAPIDQKHLDAASGLLAERQRRLRKLNPVLPASFEDPGACRSVIADELEGNGTEAVVAIAEDTVVGFLMMSALVFNPTDMIAAFMPHRPAQIHGAHAVRPVVAFDAYREMYAALAGVFVQRGYFDHMAYLPAADAAAHDAFVSLSFGRALVAAVRGVDPVQPSASSLEIHEAGIEDINVIMHLNDELLAHHTRSPIYWPHARETNAALEANQRRHLEDETTAHIVGYKDGRPVGMNTFIPPDWIDPLLRPDGTVYLYQGVVSPEAQSGGVGKAILARGVDWARDHGYKHIALHYASPNLSGARFWQAHGFEAIEYRMTRHIDERIAWAKG